MKAFNIKYTMTSDIQTNQNMSIAECNKYLVDEKIEFTINEYIESINAKFYNIDISFMNDFQNLVNQDKCCIHHMKCPLLFTII